MKGLGPLILFFFSLPAFSQVSNDQIQNRIRLSLNSDWTLSSTRKANVEWDCVNKALTNKCLVYHNDQWFTVTPPESGSYFLNIRNQSCQNLRGVQIVVLEGDPCKTDTYRLKECIPYTDQSDAFVRLDSLKKGKDYLVNIDGYLGDQCDFEIQFSDKLNGIPVKAPDGFKPTDAIQLSNEDSVVTIQFNLSDSMNFRINSLLLYRKHEKEKRSELRQQSSLYKNAYGAAENNFTWKDTVNNEGEYTYSIFGAKNDDVILLAKQKINYEPARLSYTPFNPEITYPSGRNGNVLVFVSDDSNGKVLFTTNRTVSEGKNKISLSLSRYVSQGINEFSVIISNKGERTEYKLKFVPR